MNQNIAVVGAGICGLCTGLALAAKGNLVTLYERDIEPPEGGADQAFFEWKRRGAAQFRHPHAFLGVMCNMLEKNYPDLIEQFWEAGARKMSFSDMLPPELLLQYEPEPSDDDMWMLMCRRATMETVLRRYVEGTHNVTINNTTNVVGMTTVEKREGITVTGLEVQIERGEIEQVSHDIIVDASGRGTKFPEWLDALGSRVTTEDDDADIVYYTRHYQLNPGEQEPSRHSKERSAGDLGYMKYGVFPGDNGHFAVIICLPNHETELREAIKDPDQFDDICNAIPGLKPWVSPSKSTPTTSSFGFGDIHAIWRHFVNDGIPVALNFFAVGDSAVRTNPLYGRGCSTGTIHAHLLARILDESSDPVERALRFDEETENELRPIFIASLNEDKQGIKRAQAILEGKDVENTGSFKQWLQAAFGDAIGSAAREQVHVLRGAMRTFNLMEKPGDFLKDSRIRWTILRYMLRGRAKNNRARFQRGPRRMEMLAIAQQPNSEAAA
jgi:2-polyprenyl-6-methoxyphenol hydroxylase-like FAD-dependent oxidoreductase